MSWLTDRLRRRVDSPDDRPAAVAAPAAALTDWDGAGRWPEDDEPGAATADPQVPMMLNPNSPTIGPA